MTNDQHATDQHSALQDAAAVADPLVAAETALCEHADVVADAAESRTRAWAKGFTRRRFIQGAGAVGAAALASQLVTTRAAYAADGGPAGASSNGNTLILVFLRGGCDGLRTLVPATSSLGVEYLKTVRPDLVPDLSSVVPLAGAGGWAVNASLSPLVPFWNSGELAFVPAVTASPSRSHFESQRFLEAGGVATATTGWLDRLLTVLGPGTTFRSLAEGYNPPTSLMGPEPTLVATTLKNFVMPSWGNEYAGRTADAVASLYRGLPSMLATDVASTVAALSTAASVEASAGPLNGAAYPDDGQLSTSLADVAKLLRAEVGLQVVTLDVGGWDTHTEEAADLDAHLASLSQTLAAFLTDLGPARRSRVTVAVMSEFGRRVAQNGSAGADHGYGGLMWLLGGGLSSAQVAGKWNGLSDAVLDQGDVPGLNSPFALLGELATTRLGAGSLSTVFPGADLTPLGVARAA